MSGDYFKCPQCAKNAAVNKIIKNNYACLNTDCELNVRLLVHGEVSATGDVSKIYGWVQESGTLLKKKYEIVSMIGKGGYGATYLAYDQSLFKQLRAIKETPRSYCDDKEDEFLTLLSHPAIPKLYERFNIRKFHYSVMEYIDGQSLDDIVKTNCRGLPEKKVLQYAEQLCDVLKYIHSKKVVHRDLKPENILIRNDETIALIDFGISKKYISGQGTRHLARAASYSFSSPEQYQAGKGNTDYTSDIYSFGAILYFLSTGIEPLDALSRNAKQDISPLPRSLNQSISPKLERAIVKAMKMNKNDRYASVRLVENALFGNSRTTSKKICPACKSLIEHDNKYCPNCGSATQPIKQTSSKPFIFRSQKKARNLQELVQICYQDWGDGIFHLYQRDFEKWLKTMKNVKQLSKKAAEIQKNQKDQNLGLNDFLVYSGYGKSPKLVTKQTQIELGRIEKGYVKNIVLKIQNDGSGYLKGSIKTDSPWIILKENSFSCLNNRMSRIVITINTSKLQVRKNYKAVISFESNGGNLKIPVTLTLVPKLSNVNSIPKAITLVVPKGKNTKKELFISNKSTNGNSIDYVTSLTNWLTVKKNKMRRGNQNVVVTISTKKLKIGKHKGRILIQTGKVKQYIDVILNVTQIKKNFDVGIILFLLITALIIRHLGPKAQLSFSSPWIILSMGLFLAFLNRHYEKAGIFFGFFIGSSLGTLMNIVAFYSFSRINESILVPILNTLAINNTIQINYLGWGILGIFSGIFLLLISRFKIIVT